MSTPLGAIATKVTYIGADALASMLRAQQSIPAAQRPLVVIDVRDDDFSGGHIAQALNVPAAEFLANVSAQARSVACKETVVVHCAFSQVRGPKCAGRLAAALAELRDVPAAPAPRVAVLEGGFSAFARVYRTDPSLFAEFDERVHGPEWHAN
jgi:rhodanese-related sulfurtransferase